MSVSVDCSEIITQIHQQCSLEGRQPTGEEYNHVIICLQEANMQLVQHKAQLVQMNETLNSRCTRLSEDREIAQEILRKKILR